MAEETERPNRGLLIAGTVVATAILCFGLFTFLERGRRGPIRTPVPEAEPIDPILTQAFLGDVTQIPDGEFFSFTDEFGYTWHCATITPTRNTAYRAVLDANDPAVYEMPPYLLLDEQRREIARTSDLGSLDLVYLGWRVCVDP